MKLLKKFVWLLASVALVACGGDDDTPSAPAYELSEANILGTYTMNELAIETQRLVTDGDTVTPTSTTEIEGINFQGFELTLSNGGSYAVTDNSFYTKEETVNGDVITDEDGEIVSVSDSGTYSLDVDNEVITFTSTNGTEGFFNGEFEIDSFSQSSLKISNEETIVDETNSAFSDASTKVFGFER